MTTPSILIDGRAFLEGPRWHDGALWVSDMHAQEVLRVSLDGSVAVVAHIDGDPSGLGWLADGALLVVSMRDRQLVRVEADGTLTQGADCSNVAEHEINDMVVDAYGHAFISQFGFDFHAGAPYATAPLIRVDPDGSVIEGDEALRMANGMAITADGGTLIVAESTGKDLVGFDLAADGSLSRRRIWAELPDFPDGICIDRDDGVWIASPVGDRFVRVVEGGDVTDIIDVPGRHAIACAIGGEDGRTLFLCTSSTHGQPDRSRAERGARVETVIVEIPGPGQSPP
jgi:sugar lactone lactonase YvrE